jgi:hypothetical protein
MVRGYSLSILEELFPYYPLPNSMPISGFLRNPVKTIISDVVNSR